MQNIKTDIHIWNAIDSFQSIHNLTQFFFWLKNTRDIVCHRTPSTLFVIPNRKLNIDIQQNDHKETDDHTDIHKTLSRNISVTKKPKQLIF